MSYSDRVGAREILDDSFVLYTCTIRSDELILPVYGNGISYSFDAEKAVEEVWSRQSPFLWFIDVFLSHCVEVNDCASWDSFELQSLLEKQVKNANLDTGDTLNACIDYDENTGQLYIKEAEIGADVDADNLADSLSRVLASGGRTYYLQETDYVQPTVFADDVRLNRELKNIQAVSSAHFTLCAGGMEVDEINPKIIRQWIDVDENLNAVFNTDRYARWVDDYIAMHTTLGTERVFTLPGGDTYTVSGGLYGWAFNREELYSVVLDGIMNNCMTSVDLPCISTAAVWVNADNDSDYGFDEADFGNTYCEVCISTQRMHVVINNEITYKCGVITGDIPSGCGTPLGVYKVLSRQSPTYLVGLDPSGYGYESYVNYWFAFIDSEYGIHDSPNRQGNKTKDAYDYPDMMYAFEGYGSYGCVTVSWEAGEYLWQVAYVGFPIVIHW